MDEETTGAQGLASQSATGNTLTLDVPIVADAAEGDVTNLPERWLACLVVEGMRTTDGRAIAVGALTWRDLPVPLAAAFTNEGGHYGSVVVGNIETISRDGARIMATGSFHLTNADGTPDLDGRKAAGMCADQTMRFVSIDLEVVDACYVETPDGEDGYYEVLTGRIGMSTMVPMPAFPQACIVPEGMALPEPEPMGEPPTERPMLIAAGDLDTEIDLTAPPAAWFEDPLLQELTHFTVTEQGRVYGHLAGWGIAHRGIQGKTVFAPRSPSHYAHYATGRRKLDNGEYARTGRITMGIGHAGPGSLAAAAAHYDDVHWAKADVAVGEDEFGIWFAGAVRPGLSIEDYLVMNASDVSGDWRPVGTNQHELVAALIVNVAGFLIKSSIVASASYASVGHATFTQYEHNGEVDAILAAGMVRRLDPIAQLRRELETLRAAITPLMPLAAAAVIDRIGA